MDLEKVVLQGLSLQKLLPREGLEAASVERVLSRLSRNCLHLPLNEAQSAESHLSQQGLQQQRRAWELLSCFCFLRLANPARNRRERAHLPPPGPQRLVWELCCARSPATASPERSSVRTVLGNCLQATRERPLTHWLPAWPSFFGGCSDIFQFPPHVFRTELHGLPREGLRECRVA